MTAALTKRRVCLEGEPSYKAGRKDARGKIRRRQNTPQDGDYKEDESMKKVSFEIVRDFRMMTIRQLTKEDFHWGAISFARLYDAYDKAERLQLVSLDDILACEQADEMFEAWMRRNLSDDQITLLRLFYGSEAKSYESYELRAHPIFGRERRENVEDLGNALALIESQLGFFGYLGHVLTGLGFGRKYDTWVASMLFENQAILSDWMKGLLGVESKARILHGRIGELVLKNMRGRCSEGALQVLSFVLTGVAELWLDGDYRIFGMRSVGYTSDPEDFWRECCVAIFDGDSLIPYGVLSRAIYEALVEDAMYGVESGDDSWKDVAEELYIIAQYEALCADD